MVVDELTGNEERQLDREGSGMNKYLNELFAGTEVDMFYITGGSNYLDGGDGTDSLYAADGNNTLFGEAGDDNLQAAANGGDRLWRFKCDAANDAEGRMVA